MKIKLDQVKQSQGQHRQCSTDQKLTLNDVTQHGTDNTTERFGFKKTSQNMLPHTIYDSEDVMIVMTRNVNVSQCCQAWS